MLPFNLTGLTGAEISLVDEAIQRLRLTPEGSFVLNFLENQENNSLIKFSYSSNFQDNPTGYSWLNDILQINVYQLINTRYFDNVENPTFYKFTLEENLFHEMLHIIDTKYISGKSGTQYN